MFMWRRNGHVKYTIAKDGHPVYALYFTRNDMFLSVSSMAVVDFNDKMH